MKKHLGSDSSEGGSSNSTGPDFAAWQAIQEAKGSWLAAVANRTAREIAIVGAVGALAYMGIHVCGAGSNLNTQSIAGIVAIASMITGLGVLALIQERNNGPGAEKRPNKTS